MAVSFLISAFLVGKTVSVVVSGGQIENKDMKKMVVLDAGHGGAIPVKSVSINVKKKILIYRLQ